MLRGDSPGVMASRRPEMGVHDIVVAPIRSPILGLIPEVRQRRMLEIVP
jgi:hypothetical protein